MAKAIGLALLLIGAGYFGPWAAHPAAGLTLSADDLAEWVKFLPVVRAGNSGIIRELFFISIWLAPIGLGLLARSVTSWTIKLSLLALAVLLAFTPLPKYPELLTAYQTPEFAPTFWLTLRSLVMTIGLGGIGRRTTTQSSLRGTKQSLIGPEIASQRPVREAGARQATALATPAPTGRCGVMQAEQLRQRTLRADRVAALLWIFMGLAVALIAPLHFVKVLPEIERLYHVSIGWGLIATVIGGLSLSALGARQLTNRKKPPA